MGRREDYSRIQPLRRESYRSMEWARSFSFDTARRVLATPPPEGMLGSESLLITSSAEREIVEKADIRDWVIWPWNGYYRVWWYLTVLAAAMTIFLSPFQVAFDEGPRASSGDRLVDGLETSLTWLFLVDMVVNFNLACCKHGEIIFERGQIAREYMVGGMFWLDALGTIPFFDVALLIAGDEVEASSFLMLSLLKIFHFARLHRIKKILDEFRFDAHVSLLWFTLFRNLLVVTIACHCQACCMYFLARVYGSDGNTWLRPVLHDNETDFGRYITSLYWSITTFCTVGYGDFTPVNPAEKIACSLFMMMNIVISAWIIGSITLLMLRDEEKTREYRESLGALQHYGDMHHLDPSFLNKLKDHLKLEFNNRETADEQVLKNFPSAVRRKILRRLYKKYLVQTKLMDGVRPQFVDAFLTSCNIDIFSPGEEIIERGSISSDLFLLVGGIAKVATAHKSSSFSSEDLDHSQHSPKLEVGDFIGEIGFFTETPQADMVISLTMVKTLTMPRSVYRFLAQEHPGSVGKILKNLLAVVNSKSTQGLKLCYAPKLGLRSGSNYDTMNGGHQSPHPAKGNGEAIPAFYQRQESLTAVKHLVEMHMQRTNDDETARFLFAASRNETRAISLMCDHGFDANSADYDQRSALMVASRKGNTDAVKLLLQYDACPNNADINGSSALLEATKCGHEGIMEILLKNNAKLCTTERQAASILCQAVFDGDMLLLKRLLKAGIEINAAADCDERTAAHVAAAEGNVAAMRILAEHGADFTLLDRWGNNVEDEARRSNAHQVLVFLRGVRE